MSHKRLYRFVLSETKLIIQLRRCMIPVFRAHPEFAFVATGEQGTVFLRLVFEDGLPFTHELIGTERYCHLDLIDIPLLPCTAIQPHIAVLHPWLVFKYFERAKDSIETNTVCSMRIRKIAGSVDLVRLHFFNEINNDIDILGT